ncbi:MAG: hypothetical protein EOO57_08370 [Hymenobacter sp.]|nr:MAG: hypothetical protein EOO57_08370 [Hymenobacter sp.]
MALSDVDGDGDLDLVGAVFPDIPDQPARVSIWRNDGRGFFGANNHNRQDINLTSSSESLVLADVDADGDLDLLAATYESTVNVRLNE